MNRKPREKGKVFRVYRILIDTLGLREAEFFGRLEREFRKNPDGFYKFLAPCKNEYYREGESLLEEMPCVSLSTIKRTSKKIVTAYKSESLYKKAKEELGELGVFCGMPFLSYHNNKTGQTFYLQNREVIEALFKGFKPPIINTGNVVFVNFRQD